MELSPLLSCSCPLVVPDPSVADHGGRGESLLSAGDTGAVRQFSTQGAAAKSRALSHISCRPVKASMKLASGNTNTQNSTVVQQWFDSPLLLYVARVAVVWDSTSTDSTGLVSCMAKTLQKKAVFGFDVFDVFPSPCQRPGQDRRYQAHQGAEGEAEEGQPCCRLFRR